MKGGNKYSFWPSYVDIMTTLFAIMVVLFAVTYSQFRIKEAELLKLAGKYEEIRSIYQAVENIDSTYFEFNEKYVKHIFRIQVQYQKGKFRLDELVEDKTNPAEAEALRRKVKEAGAEIRKTILSLQKTIDNKDIKYLVVIEGQASADGYHVDDYFNNDVLSYQRALALHRFWREEAGIDFSKMARCELVISGSGEGGVPRYSEECEKQPMGVNGVAQGLTKDEIESFNQRFLIHIVPVIGNIKMND